MALSYWDQNPNFVNPSYATPEQFAQQRAYANELLKRSGEAAKRPAGIAANMIDALTSRLETNRANELQSSTALQNSKDYAALIQQLQQGQGGGNAPMASAPAGRQPAANAAPMGQSAASGLTAEAPKLDAINPQGGIFGGLGYKPLGWGEDKPVQTASLEPTGGAGAPSGVQASSQGLPAGGAPAAPPMPQAMPPQAPFKMAGGLDPRLLGRILANPMVPPEQRSLIQGLIQPKATEDVYGRPAYQSYTGGVQPVAPNAGFQPGVRAPIGVGGVSATQIITPQGASVPGIGGGGTGIDALAAKGRQLEAESSRVKGGAGAEAGNIEMAVKRAGAAPETVKGLGIMEDTIKSLPGITFGPTAKLSNEARRVISNYAPGLVDQKALAGADAIEKLNLGLAGALSSQLGLNPSDIYRSVASVPGNEKSKEGTLALINMMKQAAHNDQYVGTTLYKQYEGNLGAYQQAVADYYRNHPVVNPNTGHLVMAPVSVSSPDEARSLRKGTPFATPDGREFYR